MNYLDTSMIKIISTVVGIVSLIASIGIIGGYELNSINTKTFVVSEIIFIVLMYLSYVVYEKMLDIEKARNKYFFR